MYNNFLIIDVFHLNSHFRVTQEMVLLKRLGWILSFECLLLIILLLLNHYISHFLISVADRLSNNDNKILLAQEIRTSNIGINWQYCYCKLSQYWYNFKRMLETSFWFCHTFDLKNMVNSKTCCKPILRQSSANVLLTNRPKRLQKTVTIVTGPIGCYKMVKTALRSFYTLLPTRDNFYRNHRNYNVQQFLIDLETNAILESQYSGHASFDKLKYSNKLEKNMN